MLNIKTHLMTEGTSDQRTIIVDIPLYNFHFSNSATHEDIETDVNAFCQSVKAKLLNAIETHQANTEEA